MIGQRQETYLTGILEYKYRVIFVLVLRLVFTSDGVGVGVIVGVIRELMT